MIAILRETYCRTIGVEFMHIRDTKIRTWLLDRMEPTRNLPAFEISFWAQHPRFLLFLLTALGIAIVLTFAILARRAEEFWNRIKQGVVVLTDWRRPSGSSSRRFTSVAPSPT